MGSVGTTCSCMIVSYVPSLDILAIGTLITTSSIVVPIRSRFLTTGNVARLIGAVDGIGERVGPSLGVSNILLALMSNEAGLCGDAGRTVLGSCNGCLGVFSARVPLNVGTTRATVDNGSVFTCSGGDGITGTCISFAGRILGLRQGRGGELRSRRTQ